MKTVESCEVVETQIISQSSARLSINIPYYSFVDEAIEVESFQVVARCRRCHVLIEYLPDTKCSNCFIEDLKKTTKSEGFSLWLLTMSFGRAMLNFSTEML